MVRTQRSAENSQRDTLVYHVLTAIRSEEDFWPLLNVSYALAKARTGQLTILIVRRFEKKRPDWCQIPTAMADLPIEVRVAQSEDPAEVILDLTETLSPNLLVMGWRGQQPKRGFTLGSTLDYAVHTVRCDWLVVKAAATWPGHHLIDGEGLKVLAPTAGGPNTPLALELAFNLAAAFGGAPLTFCPGFPPRSGLKFTSRFDAALDPTLIFGNGCQLTDTL
jgi:nucleotide-binding universal stress UspA family protein